MDCSARDESLLLYALDGLDGQDEQSLRAHLQGGCPQCHGRLAEARAMLAMLPVTLKPLAPPPNAREKLLERVVQNNRAQSALAEGSMRSADTGRRPRSAWFVPAVIGAALAASLTVLVYANILAKERKSLDRSILRLTKEEEQVKKLEAQLVEAQKTTRMVESPTAQVVTLKGTETQPKAMGRLIWAPKQKDLRFYADGLKTPPPGRTYELWLIVAGRKPFPAASFMVDAEGKGKIETVLTDEVGEVQASAVTEEPGQGAKEPTMPLMLSGKVE